MQYHTHWTSSEVRCLCRFDEELEATLSAAPVADTVAEAQGWSGNVQLYYHTQEHFEALAKALGIMKEWRDGVPRAAYKGVVSWQWPLPCQWYSRWLNGS